MAENEKKLPRGVIGFMAKLRDAKVLSLIPGGWVKVMWNLYSHRNPQGFAWPSQKTLARESGVSERIVREFVRWAKVALEVKVKRGQVNKYYLPLDPDIDLWEQAISNVLARKKRRQKAMRIGSHSTPKELEGKIE